MPRCDGLRGLTGGENQPSQGSVAVTAPSDVTQATPTAPPMEFLEDANEQVESTRSQTPTAPFAPIDLNGQIVVNELLCFVSNKLDILVHDILVKVCADFFEKQVIEDAKRMFHDMCDTASVPNLPRCRPRKGTNKKTSDVSDIIDLFHLVGGNVPTFVAKDLSKLPPISVDYVDMSSMLQDIIRMKADIRTLKEVKVTTEDLSRVLQQVSSSRTSETLSSTPSNHQVVMEESLSSDDDDDNVSVPHPVSRAEARISSVATNATHPATIFDTRPTVSFADIAANIGDDGFQEVHGRRHAKTNRGRARPQTGTVRTHTIDHGVIIGASGAASSIRGVSRKPARPVYTRGGVFVSRLSPNTTVNSLQDYVLNKSNIHVRCFELKSRHDSYKSFRIIVSDEHKNKLLVPAIWPQHVVIRPYFDK